MKINLHTLISTDLKYLNACPFDSIFLEFYYKRFYPNCIKGFTNIYKGYASYLFFYIMEVKYYHTVQLTDG
jgi:hypothetical protein